MKMRLAWVTAFGMLLVLSGCLDTSTKITVKPDGSGTIEKTIVLSRHLVELMKSMGNNADAASIEQGLLNEKGLKAAAAQMGKDVSFVSAQKVTTDKGNGFKALYAFKDIARVSISQNPAQDLTMPGAVAAAASAAPAAESYTFAFSKGSPAALTVSLPKPSSSAAKAPATPQAGAPTDEKMMASLKELYSDMHIVLTIEVQGKITETNATYAGDTGVTLVDMDFAKILADDAMYKKLTSSKSQDMNEVRAMVKAVPGIKVELQDPVSIRFK